MTRGQLITYKSGYAVQINPTTSLHFDTFSTITKVIKKRLDTLGVSGSSVEMINDRQISVFVKTVKDTNQVQSVITAMGKLEFKKVDASLTRQIQDNTLVTTQIPDGKQLLYLESTSGNIDEQEQDTRIPYVIESQPMLMNEDISASIVGYDPYARPQVEIRFTEAGAIRFAEITEELFHTGQKTGVVQELAIVIDDKLRYVGSVEEKISVGISVISFPESTEHKEIQKTAAIL